MPSATPPADVRATGLPAMITGVTTPDVVVDLRPPPFVRVLVGVSLVIAVVLVVVVLGFDGSPLFAAAFVAVAVGIAVVNTSAVLSYARGHRDGSLEVRNRFRTHRLDRSQVDRVLLDSVAGFGSGRRVELLLTDGTTLPLVATELPPFPWLRQRLEHQADELRAWVGAGG